MILSAKPSATRSQAAASQYQCATATMAIPAGQAQHDGPHHGGVGLEGTPIANREGKDREGGHGKDTPRAGLRAREPTRKARAPPAPSRVPREFALLLPGSARSLASRPRRPTRRSAARRGSNWERARYRAGGAAALFRDRDCVPPSPSALAARHNSRRSAGRDEWPGSRRSLSSSNTEQPAPCRSIAACAAPTDPPFTGGKESRRIARRSERAPPTIASVPSGSDFDRPTSEFLR